MFEHFRGCIAALSASFGALCYFYIFTHSRQHTLISYLDLATHLNTFAPSFHPCFRAFSSRTNWALLYFLPSYWPPYPAFPPSFFHLYLSQGDLGRAHLLSSLSTSIPSETSEAPFLSQNSPLPPFRPYPSLKLLVSPSPPSFFFFFHSAWAALFLYFLQSRLWLSHSSSFQSSFHLTSSCQVAPLLHSLSITLPASCYPH